MKIFESLKNRYLDLFKPSKRKKKRRKKKKTVPIGDGRSYTKNIVTFILINAVIWVYLTYILAFMGRDTIAEQLSIVVVKVIIYTILSYVVKALVENVFKFNFISKNIENPYVAEEVVVSTPVSESSSSSEELMETDSEITDAENAAG